MRRDRRGYPSPVILGVLFAAFLVFTLACAAAEPTATPVAPAPPAPPAAPTAAPVATATSTPVVAAPAAATPTPTKVLPTATPAVVGKAQYGGTLRVAHIFEAVDTFDPHFNLDASTMRIMWTIYNNIVKRAPDFSMVPDLANSWELSADGKSLTFHLNKGIKFQDGTDFNAKAVKWNMDYILNKDNLSPLRSVLAEGVQSVDVADDYTFTIRMPKPFRPLLAVLSERSGWIASPTAKEKFSKDYGKNPAGTGPFKLKEWLPRGDVTVVRNDSYWEKGLPYLDAIRFQAIQDYTVRTAMLRTGETDFLEDLRPTDVPLIERDPKLTMVRGEGRVWMVVVHVNEPPFNNLALRQAIAYALDKKAILDVWFDGKGKVANSMVVEGPAAWWYFPDIKPYTYDPKKAKEKLVEAGYPKGVSLTLDCDATTSYVQLCEILQAQLGQVGIEAKIRLEPSGTYWASLTSRLAGHASHFGPSWRGGRPDPNDNIHRIFHSKGASNQTGYSNPKVDQLIEEAATIYDIEKAKKLYYEINKTVADDVTEIPLVHPTSFFAMSKKVQNYVLIPDMMTKFREIWLEK